jgi:hypothetical protein
LRGNRLGTTEPSPDGQWQVVEADLGTFEEMAESAALPTGERTDG